MPPPTPLWQDSQLAIIEAEELLSIILLLGCTPPRTRLHHTPPWTPLHHSPPRNPLHHTPPCYPAMLPPRTLTCTTYARHCTLPLTTMHYALPLNHHTLYFTTERYLSPPHPTFHHHTLYFTTERYLLPPHPTFHPNPDSNPGLEPAPTHTLPLLPPIACPRP